jgi:hypothetical protein
VRAASLPPLIQTAQSRSETTVQAQAQVQALHDRPFAVLEEAIE